MAPLSPSKVVAARVREHRELHGLTQAQLAERLRGELGWSLDRSMVARIETSDRQVNVDELFLLAAALHTTPALLLTPADESELMQPTPWRPVTSNRVRAWIADSVRLWEQNPEAYERSTTAAWRRTHEDHEKIDRLFARISSIHGVESIEQIDHDAVLAPKAKAQADLVDLRIELAMRRHDWVTQVGEWEFGEVDGDIDALEADPVAVAEIATEFWDHSPFEEALHRRWADPPTDITTAEQAAQRLRTIVEGILAVVGELTAEVARRTAPAPAPSSPKRTRPEPRKTGAPA
jgi:transcriptional regulator with XRE-family HTH domain